MATNTFKNAHGEAPSSTAAAYTVPASTATVVFGGSFSNIDGTNEVDLFVTVVDTSAGTTKFIVKGLPIPINDTYFLDSKITLETTDTINIYSTATGDVDYTLALLEIS
jgi:hypothetical protein